MKFLITSLLVASATFGVQAQTAFPASLADSLYLRAYTVPDNDYHNGLLIDWSADGQDWYSVGNHHVFVKSDYGNWGPQKRMLRPQLSRLADGSWQLLFNVGETDPNIARTTSPDLIHWKPQDYYHRDELTRRFGPLPQGEESIIRVESAVIQSLQAEALRAQAASQRHAERATDDLQGRFKNLQPLATTITVSDQNTRQISDKLMGIFFEDISYAADGGLYGELVQNRDFEYNAMDRRNNDPKWTATTAWTIQGTSLDIQTDDPIHQNNPHHAVLKVDNQTVTLSNCGWDGMAVKAGAKYNFSLFLKGEGKTAPIVVTLRSEQGEILAKASIGNTKQKQWKRLKTSLKATQNCTNAHLQLELAGSASYQLDMVSLFPQDTYKNRSNGMRRDLAEALEAMNPRFIRFPGGCVAHGDGMDNLYRWKNTIGPLEARKPNWNIWNYHQTVGLGYFEYFQFCEDLGCEPLPVLAAAVPCQNSSVGEGDKKYGQQGGIPIGPELDAYIQDIFDLIEWANGDAKSNPWAKKRAEAGHPKPFGLKMIGIGNEDMITEVFEERFKLIYQAVHTRYPDIEIVGTVGPFFEGSDYEEGWRLARELNVATVDEHYYNSPGWFINNQQFYDSYQRGGTKVYLGEYAAHIPGRANNIETALAEALYLCNVERNGDVVEMTSYAPLFARKGHTSWNPDLIYFDSNEVRPTTGYEVQRLFGVHSGTEWHPSQVNIDLSSSKRVNRDDVQKRIATSCLRDAKTGEYIIKVVNYLPVANTLTLQVPFLSTPTLVSAEELSGALDALEVKTKEKEGVQLEGNTLTTTLAPYSFTVLRVR